MRLFELTEAKSPKCKFCKEQATQKLIWADGRGMVPICDSHEQEARDKVSENPNPYIVGVEPL